VQEPVAARLLFPIANVTTAGLSVFVLSFGGCSPGSRVACLGVYPYTPRHRWDPMMTTSVFKENE
jgi:hypothetical protein